MSTTVKLSAPEETLPSRPVESHVNTVRSSKYSRTFFDSTAMSLYCSPKSVHHLELFGPPMARLLSRTSDSHLTFTFTAGMEASPS